MPGAIFDANDKPVFRSSRSTARRPRCLTQMLGPQESFVLGKKFAYAEPALSEGTMTVLPRTYETDARNVAKSQAALAATRLANVLNDAFKLWTKDRPPTRMA